jgi:hypothetical protein
MIKIINTIYYITFFIFSILLLIEIKLLLGNFDLKERKIIYLLVTGISIIIYLSVFILNLYINWSKKAYVILSFLFVLILLIIFYNSLKDNGKGKPDSAFYDKNQVKYKIINRQTYTCLCMEFVC